MINPDAGYVKRLAYVLRKRDVEELREFLRHEANLREPERAGEIDEIAGHDLEVRMHKMILSRGDLADMHADARRWLREHDVEVA